MKTSHLTHDFIHDLHKMAQLGGPELVTAVERLGDLMMPILQQRMLEQFATLITEYNQAANRDELELRIGMDSVHLVTNVPATPAPNETIGELDARFALRLPTDLKERIDALATAEGISTNSWVVRTLSGASLGRPVPPPHPERPMPPNPFGQTLRGRGRS